MIAGIFLLAGFIPDGAPTSTLVVGARWYAPDFAAFTSRDSVFGNASNPVSLNRYTYAFADPMEFFDPDGRCSFNTSIKERYSCFDQFASSNGLVSGPNPMAQLQAQQAQLVRSIGRLTKWWKTAAHTTLQTLGMIPIAGEAFDALDAGLYLAQGDKANAAISLAATAPIIGGGIRAVSAGVKATAGALEAGMKSAAKAGRETAEAARRAPVGALVGEGPTADLASDFIRSGDKASSLPTQRSNVRITAAGTAGAGSGRSLIAPQTAGSGGRVFTHFTDETGALGITGTRPLAIGESVQVGQLTFAKGTNPFLVGEGRIGVTDLGLDATPGQLERIGVFGSRQQYGIQFSELDAWNSGVRVRGDLPSRNIYSIPGGCTITGTCTVTRLR